MHFNEINISQHVVNNNKIDAYTEETINGTLRSSLDFRLLHFKLNAQTICTTLLSNEVFRNTWRLFCSTKNL